MVSLRNLGAFGPHGPVGGRAPPAAPFPWLTPGSSHLFLGPLVSEQGRATRFHCEMRCAVTGSSLHCGSRFAMNRPGSRMKGLVCPEWPFCGSRFPELYGCFCRERQITLSTFLCQNGLPDLAWDSWTRSSVLSSALGAKCGKWWGLQQPPEACMACFSQSSF